MHRKSITLPRITALDDLEQRAMHCLAGEPDLVVLMSSNRGARELLLE